MVEIPHPFDLAQGVLQAKRSFGMPAQAGHRGKMQILDSRFRGQDKKEKVDFESTQENPSASIRG